MKRGKVYNGILDGDTYYSLKDFKEKIEQLIEKYGEDSLIIADAGYNNVHFNIDTSKKMIDKYLTTEVMYS